MRNLHVRSLFLLAALLVSACGGGTSQQQAPQASNTPAAASRGNVSMDKNSYPVFPDADAGADSSVSAEQGGKGFKGDGWQTNTDFDLIGDPRAVKGGTIRDYTPDFPNTLRLAGPSQTAVNGFLLPSFTYETLLGMHPTTLEYIPSLATHWQISPDKMTYRFRLDPNARWNDGQPLVADDVVATWQFFTDRTLQDPAQFVVWDKFEKPVAESKYIVRVKSKVINWRNFLYFAQSLFILPSHVLKSVNGAVYLKDWNFKILPGTGPYLINEADVVKGKSVTLRRRNDYWADKYRRNVGTSNFDTIVETTVRDENLAFEMFKKGDFDYFMIDRARLWVEELNFDRVQRGLIQKRKIFSDAPIGTSGIPLNTRKPPLDDVRVREALALLLNRPLLIQKLFFNEYTPMNSYFPGSIYENPSNPKNEYDPKRALSLLSDAGWKDHDAQGRLVKNGSPLAIELIYTSQTLEPALTVYQEDLRKVGIGLNLRLVTFETMIQLSDQRKFDAYVSSLTGLLFPNPETEWKSSLADQPNNNNVTGFKNPRVDQLLDVYDKEFDQKKRVAIIREIDGILADAHHYILFWQAPFARVAFWNKFGYPDSYLTRTNQELAPSHPDVLSLWWYDPQKQAALAKAMGSTSDRMPVGPTDIHYWEEYAKQHPLGSVDAPAASH
jgi:microcin C transport system substrate-binding protein